MKFDEKEKGSEWNEQTFRENVGNAVIQPRGRWNSVAGMVPATKKGGVMREDGGLKRQWSSRAIWYTSNCC